MEATDAFDDFFDQPSTGVVHIEVAFQKACKSTNATQRIADFVGNGGRHFAQGSEGVDPAGLFGQLLEAGQVFKGFHCSENFTGVCVETGGGGPRVIIGLVSW